MSINVHRILTLCVLSEHIPSIMMDIHVQKSYTTKHTYWPCIILLCTCNLSQYFCCSLFTKDMAEVTNKIERDNIGHLYQSVPVRGNDRGIQMTCGRTECIIEITLYKFCGTQPPKGYKSPRLVPPKKSTSGNIALIIPTQYLPEFQQDAFQRFLDGEGAIKLHARTGSPLEFVFPAGDYCNAHTCTWKQLSYTSKRVIVQHKNYVCVAMACYMPLSNRSILPNNFTCNLFGCHERSWVTMEYLGVKL